MKNLGASQNNAALDQLPTPQHRVQVHVRRVLEHRRHPANTSLTPKRRVTPRLWKLISLLQVFFSFHTTHLCKL